MANNAPNSVDFSPRPNIVNQLKRRVKQHVATIAVATGTPAVVQANSSAGITVTDTDTGRIVVTFPPGGTGAIGYTMCSLISQGTPSGRASIDLDADLTNYATGTLEISTWVEDGTSGIATAGDVTATFTLLIHVVEA